jgi:GH25 family lysozyme M1 (1,4-beta-N-acetylmuramidase)
LIPFIDVYSGTQGQRGIDWPTVARYLRSINPDSGVIVKATEGTEYTSPSLHPQRWGAHAAGIKHVGLYVYGKPSKNTGHADANFFLQAIGNDGGLQTREFCCLDLEDTDVPATADLDAYALDWHDTLTRPLGIKVVLYSAPWYLDPHNLTRDPRLADFGLWDAAMKAATPEPWRSAGKQLLFWQHDWQGHVPGIEGPVDLDWLIGPISSLALYQWGLQPDPVAGRPAVGTPDVNPSADVPTILKHCLDILKAPSPDLATLYADLAEAETRFGLQGA